MSHLMSHLEFIQESCYDSARYKCNYLNIISAKLLKDNDAKL